MQHYRHSIFHPCFLSCLSLINIECSFDIIHILLKVSSTFYNAETGKRLIKVKYVNVGYGMVIVDILSRVKFTLLKTIQHNVSHEVNVGSKDRTTQNKSYRNSLNLIHSIIVKQFFLKYEFIFLSTFFKHRKKSIPYLLFFVIYFDKTKR